MSKKLETLGLIEVTSQRQADNGTVCYHDPVTKCDYMSYESGYVRRSYKTKSWWSDKEITAIYQLNPHRQVDGKFGKTTQRIMIDNHDNRIDLIARATINYRKNNG